MALPYDVLVVGLGPAGACAAKAAAMAGLRVLAVDRKKQAGIPVQCAEFVPALIGQETPAFRAATRQTIDRMDTYVEGATEKVTPDFRGNMISRAAFDQSLVAEAQAAGAQCRFAESVESIGADGSVLLRSGAKIEAHCIIGADGPHSKIGAAVGQVNRDCVESRQISVPLLKPHSATDIFLSAEMAGGYGWLFPSGDRANLGIGVAPQFKARLKPLLEGLHRRLAAEGRVGDEVLSYTGGAIPVGGMLRPHGRVAEVSILLVGDAAGLANPITGAGINAAVVSGKLAGAAASKTLSGNHHAALDYEEELEDLFGASINRALKKRKALLAAYARHHTPTPAELKAAWIAYPEYWAA